ncbi:hypothetical protein HOY80DRAFT_1003722 [Tuber brumale]|nr:hypothetical protein HOY80DRAFT_1003722 [Tuber brumale]
MEDPREIAWQSRQDYHSRLGAVRVAFKASYAQAIPTFRREQYYKAKLPELTEWVARKCSLERPRPNDEGDEGSTLKAIGVEEQEQVVAPDPEEHALGSGKEEPIVLSDDGEGTLATKEKLPSTKEIPGAKPLTAPEPRELATKSTAPPKRHRRLRTEIERLLDTNWGGNSTAIIRSLNQNGTGNPSYFSSPNFTNGEPDLAPAAKRTRSARSSLRGSVQSPNLTQKSLENHTAKTTKPAPRKSLPAPLQPPPLSDKPYQPNSNATSPKAQNIVSTYLTKPSRPATNAQQKPKNPPRISKPKSRSKNPTATSKNQKAQTYLTTDHSAIPFQIKVIFNRYPTLYRLPRRQKRLESPKLDIHSLIYKCRRAARNSLAVAGYKGRGEGEGKSEVRGNRVVGGEGIVFLKRNAVRGRSVWGGK